MAALPITGPSAGMLENISFMVFSFLSVSSSGPSIKARLHSWVRFNMASESKHLKT